MNADEILQDPHALRSILSKHSDQILSDNSNQDKSDIINPTELTQVLSNLLLIRTASELTFLSSQLETELLSLFQHYLINLDNNNYLELKLLCLQNYCHFYAHFQLGSGQARSLFSSLRSTLLSRLFSTLSDYFSDDSSEHNVDDKSIGKEREEKNILGKSLVLGMVKFLQIVLGTHLVVDSDTNSSIIVANISSADILALFTRYLQTLEMLCGAVVGSDDSTHKITTALMYLSAMINCCAFLATEHLPQQPFEDMVGSLIRISSLLQSALSSLSSDTTTKILAIKKLHLNSAKKSVKNCLCALLKLNPPTLNEQLSLGLMDCLSTVITLSKADSYQFTQILSMRGYNYKDSVNAASVGTELSLSKEQISNSIVAALQHYANSANPNIRSVILPPEFNLSIQVVVEIVMTGLLQFNPNGETDGGLRSWSQIISSIKHFTQQALQIQIQHLASVNTVMETSGAAAIGGGPKNKFISATQPYSLAPVDLAEDEVDGFISTLLSGLLGMYAESGSLLVEGGADLLLQYDGSRALVKLWQLKSKLESQPSESNLVSPTLANPEVLYDDEDEEVIGKSVEAVPDRAVKKRKRDWETERDELQTAFKGSRGYYSIFCSRIFANPLFKRHYVEIFVPFVLGDFSKRWDLAMRVLWECHYLDYKARLMAEESHVQSYSELLDAIVMSMFEKAETALPGAEGTFVPWLTTGGQSALFRKFILSIPRLPVDSKSFAVVVKLFYTDLSLPTPTPLQRLKYGLALDVFYDLITLKPKFRKWLPLLLSNCFSENAIRRSICLRVLRRWWTGGVSIADNIVSNAAAGTEDLTVNTVTTAPSAAEDQVSLGFHQQIFTPIYGKLESLSCFFVATLAHDEPPSEHSISNDIRTLEIISSYPKSVRNLAVALVKIIGQKKEWNVDFVNSILDFHSMLVVKSPSLFGNLLQAVIHSTNSLVQNCILEGLSAVLGGFGLPKDESDISFKLLCQFREMINEPKIHDLLLSITKKLTKYPPTAEVPLVSTPKLFTRFILDLLSEKKLSWEFYCCIISGEGFTRMEMYQGIAAITNGLLDDAIFTEHHKTIYADLLTICLRPPSLLSPVELIIFLNNCCDVNSIDASLTRQPIRLRIGVSYKKVSRAIKIIFEHPNMPFTQRTFMTAISLMMNSYVNGISYPLVFTRTVLGFLERYKMEVMGIVLSQVLAPCCNLKLLWSAAKSDKSMKPDEATVGRALWEGFMLCLQETIPNCFVMLIQLSRERLMLVLDKLGDDKTERFMQWCESEKNGYRASRIREVMDWTRKRAIPIRSQ